MVQQPWRFARLMMFAALGSFLAAGSYGLWRALKPWVLYAAHPAYEPLGAFGGALACKAGAEAWEQPCQVELLSRSTHVAGVFSLGESAYQPAAEGWAEGDMDPESHRVRFKARLMSLPGPGNSMQPELFQFDGRLEGQSLLGLLRRSSPGYQDAELRYEVHLDPRDPQLRTMDEAERQRRAEGFRSKEARWESAAKAPRISAAPMTYLNGFSGREEETSPGGAPKPWYEMNLWQGGGNPEGLLVEHLGDGVEDRNAEIEGGHYDPASGTLSFHARWISDLDVRPEELSGESFQFNGTLKRDALVGTLRVSEPATSGQESVRDLNLPRTPWYGGEWEKATRLSQWEYERAPVRAWIANQWQAMAGIRKAPTQGLPVAPPGAALRFLGSYSNVRVTNVEDEPHSYGFDADLRASGSALVGTFGVHEGLDGDQPRGPIQLIAWDPATGALSFQVVLNTGLMGNGKGGWDTVAERFTFDGILGPAQLKGTLKRRMLAPRRGVPNAQQLDLPLNKSYTDEWRGFQEREYPTLEVWREKHPAPR